MPSPSVQADTGLSSSAVDPHQIEEITRVVLAVLESRSNKAPASGFPERLAKTLKTYWPLILAGMSAAIAVAAWIAYGVSPLESAKEIRQKQVEHQERESMVQNHLKLANDFLNVGQLEAAETEFTRAKELDPENTAAELGLLKVSVFKPVEQQEGYDPEVSRLRLQAILRQSPGDSHALTLLGDLYQDVDPAESRKDYDAALRSDSGNARAYENRGVLLDEQGEQEAAAADYQQAVSLFDWDQSFLDNLADHYYLRGNYQDAENLYLRLTRLDARYLQGYYMLANSQFMLGYPETAYTNLKLLNSELSGNDLKLQRNQHVWFFHPSEKETIYFYTDAEKRAWAEYLMALACALTGRDDEEKQYLAQVPSMTPSDTAIVRQLVQADLARLEKAQPQYASETKAFGEKLGGSD